MKKTLACLMVSMVVTVLAVGPASAAVTITPNPVPVTSTDTTKNVTVTYTGLTAPAAGRRVFVLQCKKPTTDPTFQTGFDCANLSEITLNPEDFGKPITFPVFRGPSPDGDADWGCFAPGDPTPAGISAAGKLTTCYLRVTADAESNNTDQQSTPFTFTSSGTPAPVPEANLAVLLPITALIVGGGVLFLQRRRRSERLAL